MAGDGGAFGQVAARGGGWCSRSLRLSQGLWGWAKECARFAVAAALALVAGRFASLVPCVVVVVLGQCADGAGEGVLRARPAFPAPGEAHQDEAAGGGRPGSPIALAPLLADEAASFQAAGYRLVVGVRALARSTACPRPGGSQSAGWVSASARPAAGGSTIPCSTKFLLRDGVWIHVRSRLVADRAPVGCWGAGTWCPAPATRSWL